MVGALDLISGASIRCAFKEYPTTNGTYKLVGIQQTLAANELEVTVNPPISGSTDSTGQALVPLASDGAEASVRVNNGKISISIPRSRFVEFGTGQDTTWVAVDLQEE